ncbi:MAG: VOC family protein [Leptolyngbyaceae cyanobacterium bins.302]|nr:VOC family protein [Leptolyngbyaceae cyanobacterium bins.302]
MTVKSTPAGYQTATPYLIISHAAEAIEFYKTAFNASEVVRLADDTGKIAHAEIKIGTSILMLADEFPEMGFRSPQSLGGSPVSMMVYVDDVDSQFQQAIAAGAKLIRPVEDQFFGDRTGMLSDPFGHVWTIATHIEDVPLEEIYRRFRTYLNPQPQPQSDG